MMHLVATALLYVFVPCSLGIWFYSLMSFSRGHDLDDGLYPPISPTRFLIAIGFPTFLAFRGYRKGSLNVSGAVAAFLLGIVMTLVNYCFLSAMITFYLLASKATRFRIEIKSKFERDAKEAAARNWIQVLCNGGVATQMAVFYFLEVGCLETAIDYEKNHAASWWAVNVLTAIACSSGDTFASELGPVLPLNQPYLITSFKKVPKGTNGGVSVAGTIASALGGFVVGCGYYLALIASLSSSTLLSSPPQWPIIFVATIAGLYGSTMDSLLGATMQYSGIDSEDNCVVERPGDKVSRISGFPLLDNHAVNLLSSFITSISMGRLAFLIWWYIS